LPDGPANWKTAGRKSIDLKRVEKIFSLFLSGAREFLLPSLCPLCVQAPPEANCFGFCANCFDELPAAPKSKCTVCSLPFDGAGEPHPCSRCVTDPPPFEMLSAWGSYEGALLKSIRFFKYGRNYGNNRALRAPLEALLLDAYHRDFSAADHLFSAVVPVPPDEKSLRRKGFDLPALVSRKLAKAIGAPWKPQALTKSPDAPELIGLNTAARAKAAAKAFSPAEKIDGTVLLVDDVATTTATMRACAHACLKAGAHGVHCLALARTKLRN